MKLSYFSVQVSYDGLFSGSIHFVGSPTSVTHQLTERQLLQLSTLIDQWKAELLQNAADKLLQARDDMLALEHAPSSTEPRVVDNDVIF
jgi:hypothetical protein